MSQGSGITPGELGKDISMRPLDLPPEQTRVEAREDSGKTLEREREEARSKCPPDPFACWNEGSGGKDCNSKHPDQNSDIA